MYMHCHALTIRQLPSCNLFTQHVSYLLWRDTTSELWTPVHSFTLIKQPQTVNCSIFILCNLILIFHTIRLILCFQQASEIDNLTVSLGQSSLIVLCADSTSTVQTPCDSYFSGAVDNLLKSCCSYWFDNLGFFLRENLLLCASYLPLGVAQRTCEIHAIKFFFWRRCRGDQDTLQGESPLLNLFTLFLSCLVLFTTLFAALNQNTKKLVASFTLFAILFAISKTQKN